MGVTPVRDGDETWEVVDCSTHPIKKTLTEKIAELSESQRMELDAYVEHLRHRCPDCMGKGKVYTKWDDRPDDEDTCDMCEGTGKFRLEADPCETC